jgi:hypothetical protein
MVGCSKRRTRCPSTICNLVCLLRQRRRIGNWSNPRSLAPYWNARWTNVSATSWARITRRAPMWNGSLRRQSWNPCARTGVMCKPPCSVWPVMARKRTRASWSVCFTASFAKYASSTPPVNLATSCMFHSR